jgi:hypothetical protein
MKKVSILAVTALLLGLIGILILVNCSGGSSSSGGGGFANVDVQYTVTGNTISHNANEARDFTDPLTGTDFRVLTWFCGNYQGSQKQRVQLTFKKTNNIWVLDGTAISGGSCG